MSNREVLDLGEVEIASRCTWGTFADEKLGRRFVIVLRDDENKPFAMLSPDNKAVDEMMRAMQRHLSGRRH